MEKNQDYVDGKIGQDYGKEPGLNGWEDRPRSWSICRWIVPETVGAYCICPQHTNLIYYHLGNPWKG